MQLSHVGNQLLEPSPTVPHGPLYQGSWHKQQSWDSKSRTPKWDAGPSTGISTLGPSSSLLLKAMFCVPLSQKGHLTALATGEDRDATQSVIRTCSPSEVAADRTKCFPSPEKLGAGRGPAKPGVCAIFLSPHGTHAQGAVFTVIHKNESA